MAKFTALFAGAVLMTSTGFAIPVDSGYDEPIGPTSLPRLTYSSDFMQLLGLKATAMHAAQCCKICSAGKACGDTCISRSKECRTPPGCACDG